VGCTTVMVGRPSPKTFPSILNNMCAPCRCVTAGKRMARLRAPARYPKELLVKCRLKVLAWARKESMQLSADDISASQKEQPDALPSSWFDARSVAVVRRVEIGKAATLVMFQLSAPARERTAWIHVPSQPLMRSPLSRSQTPAPPRRVSRFFRVWLLFRSPCEQITQPISDWQGLFRQSFQPSTPNKLNSCLIHVNAILR
jgi:hypothetical protein